MPHDLTIDRSSTTDRVAAALRAGMFAGTLGPGAALREVDLASRFGVSRGTLREALRMLEAEGLVTRSPNRGAVVKTLSAADVADLYQARRVIELGALAERQPGRGAELRAALERYEHAVHSGDEEAVTDAHLRLHTEIVAQSGNRWLTQVAAGLLSELRLALAAADRERADPAEQLGAHRRLVDVVAGEDTAAAVEEARRHLSAALAQVTQVTGEPTQSPNPSAAPHRRGR